MAVSHSYAKLPEGIFLNLFGVNDQGRATLRLRSDDQIDGQQVALLAMVKHSDETRETMVMNGDKSMVDRLFLR